ncbi:MAG: hypothetical protein F6K17_39960 [Okeania sp. SIO3C4]|nr:hypothetical protein [Okeania sp. SIO3B3]NER08288.1 hypothetical protein [Okeania sp. SIO3C4]
MNEVRSLDEVRRREVRSQKFLWALLRGGMNISGKWGQASCLYRKYQERANIRNGKISGTGKYQERARCPFHLHLHLHLHLHKTIKIPRAFMQRQFL